MSQLARPERLLGRIKFFHGRSGYGFIEIEGAADVFVHRTAFDRRPLEVADGARVSFEIEQHPKGVRAVAVKFL